MQKILLIILCFTFSVLTVGCIGPVKPTPTASEHKQSVTESKTIKDYLTAGFKAYQSFDELNVMGVSTQTHSPFVMVRLTDTLVEVVRSNELGTVLQYKKMPWGWYNRIQCKCDIQGYQLDCIFDRYIYKGKLFEIERLYYPGGREFSRYAFLKDSITCTSSALKEVTTWDENTLPDESIMDQKTCVKYQFKTGLKKSYYVYKGSDKTICYSYAKNDTDLFSRGPGMALRSTSHDIYSFQNGAFTGAEFMPIVEDGKVADYILAKSGLKLKSHLEHDKAVFWLKVSEKGTISDVVLLRPKDDELKKQMMQHLPIKCVPGTIAETPVPVWYTIIIPRLP